MGGSSKPYYKLHQSRTRPPLDSILIFTVRPTLKLLHSLMLSIFHELIRQVDNFRNESYRPSFSCKLARSRMYKVKVKNLVTLFYFKINMSHHRYKYKTETTVIG